MLIGGNAVPLVRVAVCDDGSIPMAGVIATLRNRRAVELVECFPRHAAALAQRRMDSGLIVLIDPFHTPPGQPVTDQDTVGLVARLAVRAKVLVVTDEVNVGRLPDLVTAGAAGYVAKNASKETLLDALRAIGSGGCYFAGDLVGSLITRQRERTALTSAGLSPRELEVLDLVVAGLTHKQIGEKLALAKATVDTYVQRIRQKCGNRSKVALIRLAVECGLAKG